MSKARRCGQRLTSARQSGSWRPSEKGHSVCGLGRRWSCSLAVTGLRLSSGTTRLWAGVEPHLSLRAA